MLDIIFQRSIRYSLKALCTAKPDALGGDVDYYFGYGGNLNVEGFQKKIPGAQFVGTACAKNFGIDFTMPCEYHGKGFSSIRRKQGSEVWGLVYALTPLQALLLDIFEWAPFGSYHRIAVSAKTTERTYSCYAYQATYPREGLVPSKIYLTGMINSAKKWNFPSEYQKFLAQHKYGEKFELDHKFCLINQKRERNYPQFLNEIIRKHDILREELCKWI